MAALPTEPKDWLVLFRQQIREIFSHLATLEQPEGNGEGECAPLMDMYESSDCLVVELDLPGFAREDISATVCCSLLILEGVKRVDPPPPQGRFICLERRFGRFCRTIEIPPDVDRAGICASLARGVLTVVMPKLSEANGIVRAIPIE
jgi:HSP20 family protein